MGSHINLTYYFYMGLFQERYNKIQFRSQGVYALSIPADICRQHDAGEEPGGYAYLSTEGNQY